MNFLFEEEVIVISNSCIQIHTKLEGLDLSFFVESLKRARRILCVFHFWTHVHSLDLFFIFVYTFNNWNTKIFLLQYHSQVATPNLSIIDDLQLKLMIAACGQNQCFDSPRNQVYPSWMALGLDRLYLFAQWIQETCPKTVQRKISYIHLQQLMKNHRTFVIPPNFKHINKIT